MSARVRPIIVLLTLLISARVNASIHEGSLVVSVTDPEGMMIEATVTLLIEASPRRALTQGGETSFAKVPPGVHRLQAEADGYETVIREGIEVPAAREVTVEFILHPEPDQTVTLTEETALLDPAGRATGKSYRNTALNDLPRWHTVSALTMTSPGVIGTDDGDRESLLLISRGSGIGNSRWYIDSFDVSMSDVRLSAAAVSAVRAGGEIVAITGGVDPMLSGSGLQIVATAPYRPASHQGYLSLLASDGDLGASSSVPRHLRGRFGETDSVDDSLEVIAGVMSPILNDGMWASLSLAHRDLGGTETREAGDAGDARFDEKSLSLLARIESQITSRQSARVSAFLASAENSGQDSFEGDAYGFEVFKAFVARPRLLLQGAVSYLDEEAGVSFASERLTGRSDLTWSSQYLPRHRFEAGLDVEDSDSENPGGQETRHFSFYAADTFRVGTATASLALRGESLREADEEIRELAPRAGLSWRPSGGKNIVRAGFARYADQRAKLSVVEEMYTGIEREIATGFLLTGYLVERDFEGEGSDGRWRGVELGARRRMSSGFFLDGQLTYSDDERDRGPQWAYSLSSLVQVPMAGIGIGAHLHGRDGAGRAQGGRLSDSWALDLRASKELGGRLPFTLSVDVFNITNERVLLVEGDAVGSAHIQRPRAVRLGVSTTI